MSELTTDTQSPDIEETDGSVFGPGEELALDLGVTGALRRGAEQWRAEKLQLCNWGGFDGAHALDIDWGTTLLTGGSGTGKSTIGDAWLALVQPSSTHFNAASNPSKSRARGEGSRSTVSYVRGHLDRKVTGTGEKETRKLRGGTSAVWGGIAMTFVSTTGRRFTAFKLMHVQPSAKLDSEATVKLCTIDGPLDLEMMAAAAPDKFHALALKSLLPGVTVHKKASDFQHAFSVKLGIGGSDGHGAKAALRMLERIQSGEPVPNINQLFTQFVLDIPKTIADADKALAEWDKLEETMEVLDLNRRKYEVLKDIRDLHAKVVEALDEQRIFNDLGLDREVSPWTLWCARHENDVLDQAWDTNRDRLTSAAAAVGEATTRESGLKLDYGTARTALDEYTRGELNALRTQLAQAEVNLGAVMQRRSALTTRIAPLGSLPQDETEFAALQRTARGVRDTFSTEKRQLDENKYLAIRDKRNLEDSLEELRRDRDSFGNRQGRVEPGMDTLRNQAAALAGMDPAELPYAAELIDLADGQDEWREAIETILWPLSSRILIDQEKLEAFSAAVDNAGLKGRITFEGVPVWKMTNPSLSPDRVGGKLVFKDSPFEGWLRERVAKPDLNALCVRTPSELASTDRSEVRVTIAGQTRRGKVGSAGKRNRRHIIGFSNESDLASIDAQIAEMGPLIDAASARCDDLDEAATRLLTRHEAAGTLLAETWENIDAATAETKKDALAATLAQMTSGDSQLVRLQEAARLAEDAYMKARDHRVAAEREVQAAEKEQEEIRKRKDNVVTPKLQRLEQTGMEVTEAQDELLRRYVRGRDTDWTQISGTYGDAKTRIAADHRAINATASEQSTALVGCFRRYLDSWGENHPNLEAALVCYPDFVALLDEIESYGLHQTEARFRADLAHWSGQQLLRLHNSFDSSWDEITARMNSIRDLLKELPFGRRYERLDIRVDRKQPVEVTDFRRELKSLATRRTEELEPSEVMPYFKAARDLLARIRKPDDPRHRPVPNAPSRAALLDVRRHLIIEADRIDENGDVAGTYDTLGTQSGGESQELLAFILGAALRYQLSDESSARPAFAFVVLDEAFVKADPEFAGRSMEAWQKLGFQMLVATPVDKFTGLEPLAQRFLLTTKGDDDRSYVSQLDRLEAARFAEEAAERGEHLDDDDDDRPAYDPDDL